MRRRLPQGVGHFSVFANEDPAPLRRLLAPYVADGLVDVVDWETPRPGFEHQVPQTTSCVYRYRGAARWLALIDVDEFLQPRAPGATLLSTLDSAAAAAAAAGRGDLAALKVPSVYFFDRQEWRAASRLQTRRYRYRDAKARAEIGKCVVRPERVRTFMVHRVTSGGPTAEVDPETQLRLVHYRDNVPLKGPGRRADASMAEWAPGIEAEMARVRGRA